MQVHKTMLYQLPSHEHVLEDNNKYYWLDYAVESEYKTQHRATFPLLQAGAQEVTL